MSEWGMERGGMTQLIWELCVYWRKGEFFDNRIGRHGARGVGHEGEKAKAISA